MSHKLAIGSVFDWGGAPGLGKKKEPPPPVVALKPRDDLRYITSHNIAVMDMNDTDNTTVIVKTGKGIAEKQAYITPYDDMEIAKYNANPYTKNGKSKPVLCPIKAKELKQIYSLGLSRDTAPDWLKKGKTNKKGYSAATIGPYFQCFNFALKAERAAASLSQKNK
jgi:hypothetical protein